MSYMDTPAMSETCEDACSPKSFEAAAGAAAGATAEATAEATEATKSNNMNYFQMEKVLCNQQQKQQHQQQRRHQQVNQFSQTSFTAMSFPLSPSLSLSSPSDHASANRRGSRIKMNDARTNVNTNTNTGAVNLAMTMPAISPIAGVVVGAAAAVAVTSPKGSEIVANVAATASSSGSSAVTKRTTTSSSSSSSSSSSTTSLSSSSSTSSSSSSSNNSNGVNQASKNVKKSSFQLLKNKLSSAISLQSPFLHVFTTLSKSSQTTSSTTPSATVVFQNSKLLLQPSNSRFFSIKRIISFLLLSFTIVIVAVFAQGISHLLTYRNHFGHAPIPQSPTHGVIVAYSNDIHTTIDINQQNHDHHNTNDIANNTEQQQQMMMNYTFKAFNPPPPSSSSSSSSSSQPPLRLLVIGDSLARGVGQAHNCYPVLPQSLAKYLSQHLKSRIVYWTAMAQPGASTKWLLQQVEEEMKKKTTMNGKEMNKMNGNGNPSHGIDDDYYSLKQFKDLHLSSTTQFLTKADWVTNLQYHRKLYEQNPFLDYDIVIVISGLNDVKRMLVPFLFEDEIVEKEESNDLERIASDQQHHVDLKKKKERGFAADLQKLIHLLNQGNPQNNKTLKTKTQVSSNTCSTTNNDKKKTPSSEQTCRITNNGEGMQHDEELPMIVFPRFPTSVNPVKMSDQLRSIAIYFSGCMDEVKVRISNQFTNVISPDPPGPKTAFDYLAKHPDDEEPSGLVTKKSEVMVNLIDTKYSECEFREKDMSEFYSKRDPKDYCIYSPVQKLFAPDGLHPSDFGYDYFGELLGMDIMEKWGDDRLS